MSLQNLTNTTLSKRKLLIPHKRGLLKNTKQQHSTLNPSAGPAEIQFRRPVFSSVGEDEDEDEDTDETQKEGYREGEEEENPSDSHEQQQRSKKRKRKEVVRIEFDSSQAPQPFLEPDVLERIRERQRQRQEQKKQRDNDNNNRQEQESHRQRIVGSGVAPDAPEPALNTEREIRRRAVQSEYGSMAVRRRMAVSGRGRRR